MIVLMGVAGAGKSMQGKMLADEHGYAWISTGEILRVLVTGRRRQEMLQGKLLSDDEMIAILDKIFELIDTDQEFILDGFPRTVVQADWLFKQTQEKRFKLSGVIHLSASEEVVRKRLETRGRLDDTNEAISQRFQEYNSVTVPILEHFKHLGISICDIDASRPPREVHDAILKCVD
jgi:adenylate kinase